MRPLAMPLPAMPLVVRDVLETPLLTGLTRHLRPVARAGGAMLGALRAIRHPNTLLCGLVLLPVIAGGFAFGQNSAPQRAQAAVFLSALSVQAGFGIQSIRIEGLRDTRQDDVLDYLAIGPGTSLIGYDLDSARARVLALPWVR